MHRITKVVFTLIFVKIKNALKKYLKIREHFIVIVLYCTKRRYSQIEPHLTVKIEVGREAPLNSIY